jgi:hypothetical protein
MACTNHTERWHELLGKNRFFRALNSTAAGRSLRVHVIYGTIASGPGFSLQMFSARASRTTRGGWTRGCWTVLTVKGVEMVSSFRIWSGTPSGSLEQMFRPEIIETPNSRAETSHSMETNEPNRSNSQSHFWCCRHVHCGAILRDFFN